MQSTNDRIYLRRPDEPRESADWVPLADGFWQVEVLKPQVKLGSYGKYRVFFQLQLTQSEQDRHIREHGAPPSGKEQSFRCSYWTPIDLGEYDPRSKTYVSSKFTEFTGACLGSANVKTYREWVAKGGGPPRGEDSGFSPSELEEWLEWFEGLEVLGTSTQSPDKKDPRRIWANFGTPMAIGSIPGNPNPEYQEIGRARLTQMMGESSPPVPTSAPAPAPTRAAAPPAPAEAPPDVRFRRVVGSDGQVTFEEVPGDTPDDEAPF